MPDGRRGFYEFFAGGGMARLGLGPRWRCLFANDACEKKSRSYRANFGAAPEFVLRDVAALTTGDLPGQAVLSWASFPCQDLSLAGAGRGLAGRRSGTFWPFWRLIEGLAAEGRAPHLIAIENVVGAITSRQGADLRAIAAALAGAGYRFGPLVVDAVHFTPQSRPRLFIVAVRAGAPIPASLVAPTPVEPWCTRSLAAAWERTDGAAREAWIWWRLPPPPAVRPQLRDILEATPEGVGWRRPDQTAHLLELMSPIHREKVRRAQQEAAPVVGAVYRRTRTDEHGQRAQRAEVRFDQVCGCLRTPAGGSSRQSLLFVDGESVRSRLVSPRETARLMGVPDSYRLPAKYNEAYHLMGDAVAAPAVSWLERHLLSPLACCR